MSDFRDNQLTLGAEMAMGYGVDVVAVQRMSFIGGSVATAGVVSLTGPIGFVGLIVPHTIRGLSGFDHRITFCRHHFLPEVPF